MPEVCEMTESERKMRAALELIWHIAVNRNGHLGYERYSGIQKNCIPCICAAGLDRGMDDVSADEMLRAFERSQLDKNEHVSKEDSNE